MYDVGQRISTPNGEAIVTGFRLQSCMVVTDRGTFPEDEVSAYLDREALRDPEILEAWIEGKLDQPSDPHGHIEAISAPCSCACGAKGNCHRLMHVNSAGLPVKRFPHSTITTACRCALRECACLA